MSKKPADPQHDPDVQAAEQLVLDAFDWSLEDAARHYSVYVMAVQAVVKGIRHERKRHIKPKPVRDRGQRQR